MRGKRDAEKRRVHRERIIPAHAGQTYRYGCGRHRQPDHPRACGANPVRTVPSLWASGSSPRMRGKQTLRDGQAIGVRIIPAHAGQTLAYYKPLQLPSDHPRACGANSALRPSNILQSGSSPRMRGKRRCQLSQMARDRIIPAHAGQTTFLNKTLANPADHPRACGANGVWGTFNIRGHGSSPRMRGKPTDKFLIDIPVKIIPAHAGQTSTPSSLSNHCSDHPRACGAN